MATGLGLYIPADRGVLDTPTTRHGEVLKDAAGNDVAVIVGSFESNGAEPWNIFGERKWLAVATAQFRVSKQVGWYNVAIPRADAVNYAGPYLAPNNVSADASGWYVSSLTTEAHMDATFAQDANQDSKRKTDLLLQGGHPSSYPPDAATWCRSLVPVIHDVPTPMDLPRQSVVMRIYQARDLIDAIDPTAAGYSSNRLQQSTWGRFAGGSYAHVWSSSVCGPNTTYGDWYVRYDGYAGSYSARYNAFGVVAVLEIPAS